MDREAEDRIKKLGIQIRKYGEIIGTTHELVFNGYYLQNEEVPLERFRYTHPLKERRKIKRELKRIKRESSDKDVKRAVDWQFRLTRNGTELGQMRNSLEDHCSKLINDIRKGPIEFITEHPFYFFMGTYASMIGAFKIYELFNK